MDDLEGYRGAIGDDGRDVVVVDREEEQDDTQGDTVQLHDEVLQYCEGEGTVRLQANLDHPSRDGEVCEGLYCGEGERGSQEDTVGGCINYLGWSIGSMLSVICHNGTSLLNLIMRAFKLGGKGAIRCCTKMSCLAPLLPHSPAFLQKVL